MGEAEGYGTEWARVDRVDRVVGAGWRMEWWGGEWVVSGLRVWGLEVGDGWQVFQGARLTFFVACFVAFVPFERRRTERDARERASDSLALCEREEGKGGMDGDEGGEAWD